MNRTSIEYVINPDGTPGFTWNPVTGCEHGCSYCYARRIARRFGKTEGERNFKPVFHPDRLDQPCKRKKPSTIFAVNMGDLFGDWVPAEWIHAVLDAVNRAPQHTYLFLTKNPKRYPEVVEYFRPNHWLGLTTGDASLGRYFTANIRMGVNWNVWISYEPLSVDYANMGIELPVDWVVFGAQTKPNIQPDKKALKRFVDIYRGNNIPIFMKNNLEYPGQKLQEKPFVLATK